MSSIVFVRHAQASFFADDYDRLSQMGREQAVRLGHYWRQRGESFDAVYCGPRERHHETISQATQSAGGGWPNAIELPGLDEHAAYSLLGSAELHRLNPSFEPLAQAFHRASRDQRKAAFYRYYEVVVKWWVHQVEPTCGIETWADFRSSVMDALETIQSGPRHRRIVAVASAGTITVVLQHALGCSVETAIDLGGRLRNSSLTEFVFSPQRFTLDSFNSLPHLDNSLWTSM